MCVFLTVLLSVILGAGGERSSTKGPVQAVTRGVTGRAPLSASAGDVPWRPSTPPREGHARNGKRPLRQQQALPMGKSGAGAPELHHDNRFPDVVDSAAPRKR